MFLRILVVLLSTGLLTACYRHDGAMAPVVDVHPQKLSPRRVIKRVKTVKRVKRVKRVKPIKPIKKIKAIIPIKKYPRKIHVKPKTIRKAHHHYQHDGTWQWPVHGKVIRPFSTVSKGLDIAGHLDQPIKAAAAGVVIYAGNGLRGYGNLLIIKHSSRYLSAYAYNKSLLVKVNDRVQAQQVIATMGRGRGSHQQAMLHFEIRRMGKPVDPRLYLGKRRL